MRRGAIGNPPSEIVKIFLEVQCIDSNEKTPAVTLNRCVERGGASMKNECEFHRLQDQLCRILFHESYQTQKFIGPLMPTALGGLSARDGNIRRAPLVGAESVCSIQDGSGADEQRPPRKAAKRDSREARTPCCGSKVQ